MWIKQQPSSVVILVRFSSLSTLVHAASMGFDRGPTHHARTRLNFMHPLSLLLMSPVSLAIDLNINSQQSQQAYTPSEARYTPTDLEQAFHTMTLHPPNQTWYADTGETSPTTHTQVMVLMGRTFGRGLPSSVAIVPAIFTHSHSDHLPMLRLLQPLLQLPETYGTIGLVIQA
ncbi:hypothetical protein Lser_V15G28895 [Lactuca serriola]